MLFKMFGMEFAFSASFITAAVAIFPFIPTILIYFIAAAGLYFQVPIKLTQKMQIKLT